MNLHFQEDNGTWECRIPGLNITYDVKVIGKSLILITKAQNMGEFLLLSFFPKNPPFSICPLKYCQDCWAM